MRPDGLPAGRGDHRRMQTVGDVMHRGLICCRPESSIVAIARTMAAHRIHCVVVPGVGIVTDVELAAALDGSPLATAAALARPAPTLGEGETLQRAAAVLHEHRATHAVVVDSRLDSIVGVLSTLDLADALAAR